MKWSDTNASAHEAKLEKWLHNFLYFIMNIYFSVFTEAINFLFWLIFHHNLFNLS